MLVLTYAAAQSEQLILVVEVEEVNWFNPTGGHGGKGVVILSVPTASYSATTTGSPTVTTSGSNTIMQFNGQWELHSIMASFAKIGLNNKVIEVLSVVNEVLMILME
jgi:hypothetical protein